MPLILLGSLHRVDLATHKNLFAEQEEMVMEDQEGSGEVIEDQATLVGSTDQLIPWPQDWVGCFLGGLDGLGWVGGLGHVGC